MRRVLAVLAGSVALTVGAASPALACGGLIGPNGAVNLLRTTTFAGYHDGIEHYVTSFAFAGGGGAFGSLTPLPGIPTKVERGGDWTLQRLIRETTPPSVAFRAAAPTALVSRDSAEVILKTKVDALDITVLRGGGDAVGKWATDHGFRLPADAPEVLDFYASRSPIFLAAAFDADEAKRRGQQIGDGTPVHITIPTDNPWVPLRILGLGKQGEERVDADIYLLTARRPKLLSTARIGDLGDSATLRITHDARASESLLTDLRTDKTGGWVPRSGWLTKVEVGGPAGTLTGDLAIDADGVERPSMVRAGFAGTVAAPELPKPPAPDNTVAGIAVGTLVAMVVLLAVVDSRRRRRA